MKITIEPSSKLVELDGVLTRVWEGTTDSGVPVHCFIARVAPSIEKDDPRQEEFAKALKEQRAPSAAITGYPARLIL